MSDEFEAVTERVRERVDPGSEERERLDRVAATLIERCEDAIADLPISADVLQVGSTARGTWTSGDRDIDVFVRFPADLSREDLESYGLRVGWSVLPDGREEFAEHPYVTGEWDGFAVDVVPCYAVESASAIQSAVDRTPFHSEYVADHIDQDGDRDQDLDLASEVRLAKGFLKGTGIYGSDLRTEGFSGYLTELLVLEYGSFRGLIEESAEWRPPVELDPEGHGARSFDDPLVVIDPTDPERNVAAVCTQTNVSRLIHHARAFRNAPSVDRFVSENPDPLSPERMRIELTRRETTPIAVRFDAPDLVDDQLYPQLERSLGGVQDELDRRGFETLRSAAFADDTAVLFIECEVTERPAIERHEGPPVSVAEHATEFYEKYADSDTETYGPFIDGDRYVVERPREFTTVRSLLESETIFSVALGVRIETALREGYEVLVGQETTALAEEFGVGLARYFDPKP
jgi:tRNA nucleotidyltransferase (CCA-adding enzyme)